MEKKELKVSAIKNGTVIDHIPAKDLFKVIRILGLDRIDTPVTFGNNLDSQKFGKKAIIKVSDKFFEDKEINKIALIAPTANLNIIRDYEVKEKRPVELPATVKGICKCINPKCIMFVTVCLDRCLGIIDDVVIEVFESLLTDVCPVLERCP